ncbi:MAG: peptidase domain-containing ABC transporter [Erysipelothrix sp.]
MFTRYYNVLQHDQSDCAAACVGSILKYYKKEQTLMNIRLRIGTDQVGTSVKGIVDGLKSYGFNVKPVRMDLSDLSVKLSYPFIAHIRNKEGFDHFVVVYRYKKDKLVIADPGKSKVYKESVIEFEKYFTGVCIFMAPTNEFESIQKSDISMVSLYRSIVLPHKRMFVTIILSSLVLSIFGIVSSLFSKVIMDEIIPYQMKQQLYMYLIVFVVVTLFQSMLSAMRQYVYLYLSRNIDFPLLMGYYDHVMRLPYNFFGMRSVGDILTRFQDATTIKDIFTSITISLIMDVILAVVSTVVLLKINAQLFLVLLVMMILNLILIITFKGVYKRNNKLQMEFNSEMNSHLIESIQNIETVKACSYEKKSIKQLESKFVNVVNIGFKQGKVELFQGLISNGISNIGNILFLGLGAISIIDGDMTLGDLMVFQTLSQYFIEPVQSLIALQMSFMEADISIQRLKELMDLKPELDEGEIVEKQQLSKFINFDNVVFSYGSKKPILNGLNMRIDRGKKTAIVGPSGSGKTTIAKLLLKMMNIDEGDIEWDLESVNDINTISIRNSIAYVPQNVQLFSSSIYDNLTMNNSDISYEQVKSVSKITGVHEFVSKLSNRYDTKIEEGGMNLSGGEKQKIALTRALLNNPSLYILDEVTSNLDIFSEAKILDIMFNTLRDKTMLIIAHRLSTIQRCDVIYFLDGGKIVEFGSYQELMNEQGNFFKMVKTQEIQ